MLLLITIGACGSNTVCTNPSTSTMKSFVEEKLLFFPPGEESDTLLGSMDLALDVIIGMSSIRILSIDPSLRTFTAAFHTDMYWTMTGCLQTTALKTACASRLGTWYFVEAPYTLGAAITKATYSIPASDTAGALLEFGTACTSGDFLSVQTTFVKSYDMSSYPFESHILRLRLASTLTNQSVRLNMIGANPAIGEYAVPSPWTMEGNWDCYDGTYTTTEAARGGVPLTYSYFECAVKVSKVDIAWWLNSFIIYLTIVLTNCFLSLGFTAQPISSITGAPPDPHELPLQLSQRAGMTATFVLAYIFAVEYKPYDQPLGYFSGGLPLSAITYFAGLCALCISGLWTAVAAYASLVMVQRAPLSNTTQACTRPTHDRSRTAAFYRADAPPAVPTQTRNIIKRNKVPPATTGLPKPVPQTSEMGASPISIESGASAAPLRALAVAFVERFAVIDWYLVALVHAAAVMLPIVFLLIGASSYTDID